MSLRLPSALFLVPALMVSAQSASHNVTAPVPSGQIVALDLEAGEYDVVPSDKAQVSVTWERGDRVKVQAEPRDGGLRVRVGNTPHQDFLARIEVPKVCTLKIRLTAGELRIGAIEGSKDIRNRAGEVHLDIPDPKAYGEVYASSWAGEIQAPAFGGGDEGVFNGFRYHGSGPHQLRVKVMAGEIHLGK